MKIYKILFPLTIISMMSVTSCNKGFSRANYKEIGYSDFAPKLKTILANQEKDGHTTLFDEGSIKFTYDFSLNGYCRIDEFSLNDLDIAFNGEIKFAWSKGNNYLKISSPKEIGYYVKSDKDGNWYHARELEKGEKYSKMKHIITPIDNLCDWVVERADYILGFGYDFFVVQYLVLPTIKIGLTGRQNEASDYFVVSPELIYTGSDYRQMIDKLRNLYGEEGRDGNYIRQRYGSDDDGSVSAAIRTRMDLKDNKQFLPGPWLEPLSEKTLAGYSDIDCFTAWKDNFIYQNDLISDTRIIHSMESNIDVRIKLNIREEVSKECTIDNINLDDYGEEE